MTGRFTADQIDGICKFSADSAQVVSFQKHIAACASGIAQKLSSTDFAVAQLAISLDVTLKEWFEKHDISTRFPDDDICFFQDRYPDVAAPAWRDVNAFRDYVERCFALASDGLSDDQFDLRRKLIIFTRQAFLTKMDAFVRSFDGTQKGIIQDAFELMLSFTDHETRELLRFKPIWMRMIDSNVKIKAKLTNNSAEALAAARHAQAFVEKIDHTGEILFNFNWPSIVIRRMERYCIRDEDIDAFKSEWDIDLINVEYGLPDQDGRMRLENLIIEDLKRPITASYSSVIDTEITESQSLSRIPETVAERLSMLDHFVADNPGKPVSGLVSELFPALEQFYENPKAALPTSALLTWMDAKASAREAGKKWSKTPPEFIQEVYGAWLGKGFTRKLLGQLDPQLYRAFYNWLGNPDNELPSGFDLPTVAQENSQVIEELRAAAPDGKPRQVLGDFSLREAERIMSAMRRREK